MNPITLLTDFGVADGYVGTMKGVILGIAPAAPIIDISHLISPQNIAEGAFVLSRAYRYFPRGTVHVVVIDPGVGGARRPVLLDAGHSVFIGPDNGVFSYVLTAETGLRAYHLDAPDYWLPAISTTFHGRDIFAPCAAHVARGVAPEKLGTPIPIDSLVRLPNLQATAGAGVVRGQVVHIDRFGNVITNIPASMVAELGAKSEVAVRVGGQNIAGVAVAYTDVAVGAMVALISSGGSLEISVRNGDASRRLGCRAGDWVECRAAQAANSPENS
jgi:S-adenosylmethionine hydrolase